MNNLKLSLGFLCFLNKMALHMDSLDSFYPTLNDLNPHKFDPHILNSMYIFAMFQVKTKIPLLYGCYVHYLDKCAGIF